MKKLIIGCAKIVGGAAVLAMEFYVIRGTSGVSFQQLPEFFIVSLFGSTHMAKLFGIMMLPLLPLLFVMTCDELAEKFHGGKGENE